MKRSDAIKKLAIWYKAGNIGGHVFSIPNHDNMDFYLNKSELLLNFIEKELGMLPPGKYEDCVWYDEQSYTWDDE